MKIFIILVLLIMYTSCAETEKGETPFIPVQVQDRTDIIEAYVKAKLNWFGRFKGGDELSVEDAIGTMGFVSGCDPLQTTIGHGDVTDFIKVRRNVELLYKLGFVINKKKNRKEEEL